METVQLRINTVDSTQKFISLCQITRLTYQKRAVFIFTAVKYKICQQLFGFQVHLLTIRDLISVLESR